jgi:quercetin dioxygenase-like cupin family protein
VREIPPQDGSQLSLDAVDGPCELGDDAADTLLFVHGGSGSLELDGRTYELPAGSAALVLAGERAALSGEGLEAVRLRVAPGELHAPMGEREVVVQVDEAARDDATGGRTFQILFGPHNGLLYATVFLGYVPPGAAKWHYHLYDEIVRIDDGRARLHLEEGTRDLGPGDAFRLTPRQLHIVENLSGESSLVTLGIFTPAGSPSAAYLPS